MKRWPRLLGQLRPLLRACPPHSVPRWRPLLRACPPYSVPRWRAMLRACPPLLCAQVAATAQGSRKSKAMAAWPGALQTRACPSHAPSSQCSAPWRNASTWGLLLGSGHQVGLRGNTDHSNRLSSSQLPFQSSEYLKAEGLGAPVMLARKQPLRLLLFPGPDSGLRGSRACGARQGAVCRPCSAFTAFTVVSLSVPAYGKQDWSPFMAVKTVAKISQVPSIL